MILAAYIVINIIGGVVTVSRVSTHTLNNLSAKDKRYWQPTGYKNLYVMVTERGAKSWYFRGVISKGGGKKTAINYMLGSYGEMNRSEAEDMADVIRHGCSMGTDPRSQTGMLEEVDCADTTLQHYWEEFDLKYLQDPNKPKAPAYIKYQWWAWKKYCAAIEPDPEGKVLPVPLVHAENRIGSMAIRMIDTGTMERLFWPLSATPTTYNRLRAMLHKFFNWCMAWYPREFPSNPVRVAKADENDSRNRNLSVDELHRFGKAWRESTNVYKFNILFLLLTGSRAGIIVNWDPAWIQEEPYSILRISSRTPGTKNTKFVILPTPVKAFLPKISKTPNHLLATCLDQICKAAGIVEAEELPLPCLHDLRRTFSSRAGDIDESDDQTNAVLGHSTSTDIDGRAKRGASRVSDTYLRRAISPLVPVAERISTHIKTQLDIVPAQPAEKELQPEKRRPAFAQDGSGVHMIVPDLKAFLDGVFLDENGSVDPEG